MRTVFLGTSNLAAGVLRRLAASPHRPALVVSRPDRPKGRGRRLACPPVAVLAKELSLPLYQPESVNSPEAVSEIDAAKPDLVVVCAFGALIKEPLLSLRPMLNVHPSLLPRWRGAAPIERAIIADDDRTGVSIMKLTAGLDSGPVCLSEELEIRPEDDQGSLATRLCALGGELLVRALDLIDAGEPPPFVEQDDAAVTYAEKIGPGDRLLDPSRPAAELARIVRALHPHIGAKIERQDGSTLGVLRARALSGAARSPSSDRAAAPPPEGTLAGMGGSSPPEGTLAAMSAAPPPEGTLAAIESRLLLGTSDGALELLAVQPPGGRAMDAQAFLRGHAL